MTEKAEQAEQARDGLEGAQDDRNRIIVRTSVTGIITNVFLAGFKAAVGLVSHSIAVVLDAVNNLSDALHDLVPEQQQCVEGT